MYVNFLVFLYFSDRVEILHQCLNLVLVAGIEGVAVDLYAPQLGEFGVGEQG